MNSHFLSPQNPLQDKGGVNSPVLGRQFIPINWDQLLKKYYPVYNQDLFKQCLKEICEWRDLLAEEFYYIILGCGYLFEIKEPNPEKWLKKIKQEINKAGPQLGGSGQLLADLTLDEKAVKRKIQKIGLVIGPEERLLTLKRKSGPHPQAAPRIAALATEVWIKKQLPQEDLTWLMCNLYYALSGRKIKQMTFTKMRNQAEQVTTRIYLPNERDVPVIERLVDRFSGRYERLKEEELEYRERYERYKKEGIIINHPFQEKLQKELLRHLYSFEDAFDKMLKAVGVDLVELPQPPQSFSRAFQPVVPKTFNEL